MKTALLYLEDNILRLKVDKKSIIPDGMEVFRWKFRNQETINGYTVDKENCNISYAKFPKMILMDIIATNNEIPFRISLKFNNIGSNLKDFSPKIIENKIIDHIIIDETWYVIEKSSIIEIEKFLDIYNIKNFNLDLSTFIRINKNIENHEFIDELFDYNQLIDQKVNKEKSDYKNLFFNGELYDYQHTGYDWLRFYNNNRVGGILADQMGLGKTIQIISLVCNQVSESKKPNLIIVRSTLIHNWLNEFKKFTKQLNIYKHHGGDRRRVYDILKDKDVVITSYDLIAIDLPVLESIDWNLIVLDEAQDIRNPEAQRTKSIKKLKKNSGFAVTGTPIQNKLQDLWSIIDFTNPDYLGSRKDFISRYPNDFDDGSLIEPLVRPLILRRTLESSGKSLPERIDIPEFLEMNMQTRDLYENEKEIFRNSSVNNPLPMLTKLRQLCTNSSIIDKDIYWDEDDIKCQRLIQICEEFISNNEKFLIFTSFTKSIEQLSELFKRKFNIPVYKIYGETDIDDRQNLIDRFTDDRGSGCMILNPAVGSAGLNIVCANHVIHYNLEWNPAVIDQASARSYRLGQEKNVTVHYLIYADSIESYIYDRLKQKKQMADDTIIGVQSKLEIDDIVNNYLLKGENKNE